MTPTPRVSVCIPTFRRPTLLRRAVESVLSNGFPDCEIVVSDDASDPAIAQMLTDLNDPRIRYFPHPRSGIAANWTHAVTRATAPYVMKLDDDDYLGPGFLSRTVKFLDDHPSVSIVFAAHVSLDETGAEHSVVDTRFFAGREVAPGIEYARAILLNEVHPVNHKSAGVFRKDKAAQIGFFDNVTVDVMFTLGMASLGDVGYISEPLFVYCFQGEGTSEGMGWRPLEMTLQSLPRLFDLPSVRSHSGWTGMEGRALRTMRLVVPLMYIGNHFTRLGFRAGWRTARRVAAEFSEVKQNALYWPSVAWLSLIPRPLYDRLCRYYSRHHWPKRILSLAARGLFRRDT